VFRKKIVQLNKLEDIVRVHNINAYGGMNELLHSYTIFGTRCGEWLGSHAKSPYLVGLNKRLHRPQSAFVRIGEEVNIFPLTGIKT
jgi:hypothetical protein